MLDYFLVGWRNIRRNKGFAFLNIIGFSLGLAAFLLVVLFVAEELGYDRHHQHHDKIFRADTELKYNGMLTEYAITAPPLAEALGAFFFRGIDYWCGVDNGYFSDVEGCVEESHQGSDAAGLKKTSDARLRMALETSVK